MPASDLERSKDVSSLMGASKAALRCRSQTGTAEEKLRKHSLDDLPDLLAASNKKTQAGEIRRALSMP